MSFFQFFVLITQQFFFDFQQAAKDNLKLKETEEKIRVAKQLKEQQEIEKNARKKQQNDFMRHIEGGGGGKISCKFLIRRYFQKFLSIIKGAHKEGVMDTLLEALSSGEAFPQRAKPPGKRTPRSGKRSIEY